MSEQKRKSREQGQASKGLAVKPAPIAYDVHEAMKEAGLEDTVSEEDVEAKNEEEEALAQEEERARKRYRRICFCLDPSCNIGAFTAMVEEK